MIQEGAWVVIVARSLRVCVGCLPACHSFTQSSQSSPGQVSDR